MPNVYKTVDNENFVSVGNAPDQIKQLIWQGLPGKYIGVTANGLLTTIDYGTTWGYIYPNTEFATALPGGASGYQVAFAIGPRGGGNCEPIGSGCTVFPVTFAAWNNTGGAATPFNSFILQSLENNIAGVQSLADAFKGSDQDFLEYVVSLGSANSATLGPSNISYIEDGTVRTVILAVVSRISVDYPAIPTPVHAEMSNWNLIDTVTFGDNSRLSVFSGRWDDTSLLPLTIDFGGVVQEAITCCLRVLTGAAVASPSVSSRSAYGIPQGDTTFDIGIQFSAPYTGDNHTWSVDDIDGGAGEGANAGAAAIALEIQRCAIPAAYGISFIALLPGNSGPGGSSFGSIDGQGLWFQQQYNNNANGPAMWSVIKEGTNAWGNNATNFYALDEVNSGSGTSIDLNVQTINTDDVIFVTVVSHLVPHLVNPTISDTQGLTWQFQSSHGPPAGLYMYTWTTTANAAVVSTGTTVTIDYGAEVQNAITALAVGLQNATEPDVATIPVGAGAFAGSGSGNEDTIVTESSGGFSPGLDHTWDMIDFTQSLALAFGIP